MSDTALEQTLRIKMPDQETLKSAQVLLEVARTYKIDSPEMMEAAGEDLKNIKAKFKDLDELRKSITKPLDEAKARVMDLFRGPLEFLNQAEDVLKRSILNYQREEQRKALEAQAKAEEEARKKREALEAKASKADESGKVEKADALRQEAAMTTTQVVAPAQTKVTGLATRTIWKARITDKAALVKAALERPDVMALIEIDEGKLNKLASALKENLSIPGVQAYSEENLSARAAA